MNPNPAALLSHRRSPFSPFWQRQKPARIFSKERKTLNSFLFHMRIRNYRIAFMVGASMFPPLRIMPIRPLRVSFLSSRADKPKTPDGSTTSFIR